MHYSPDDGSWPDCPRPGCPNKICIILDSPVCFVHTEGDPDEKRERIADRRRELGLDN